MKIVKNTQEELCLQKKAFSNRLLGIIALLVIFGMGPCLQSGIWFPFYIALAFFSEQLEFGTLEGMILVSILLVFVAFLYNLIRGEKFSFLKTTRTVIWSRKFLFWRKKERFLFDDIGDVRINEFSHSDYKTTYSIKMILNNDEEFFLEDFDHHLPAVRYINVVREAIGKEPYGTT